ncbi:hypothetical protein H2248_004076 [Termitomyces sp. 'cryptogamus']|nr:hypothetical protein H2248_004076 [Termitomyces sp. 'cryptogamus']
MDPLAQKAILSNGRWAVNVEAYHVDCKGCGKTIKLDVRYGEYYRSNWTKHRNSCKVILETIERELETTRTRTENHEGNNMEDYHMDQDMDMDSDSEQGVIKNERSSTVLPLLTFTRPSSNSFVENPFKESTMGTMGHVPPRLAYKLARHNSAAVVMLDQSTTGLLPSTMRIDDADYIEPKPSCGSYFSLG